MAAPWPKREEGWKAAFIVGVTISTAFAALFGVVAYVLFTDLSHVSACDGGIDLATCQTPVGIGVEEWNHGTFSNGSYVYTFVIFPVGLYQVNSTALTLAFQTSEGANVTPGGLEVYSFQGTAETAYVPSTTGWIAAQPVTIDLPSLIRLSSPTSLVDDSMEIADPTDHFTIWIGIT